MGAIKGSLDNIIGSKITKKVIIYQAKISVKDV
jgi:hypothetical protein